MKGEKFFDVKMIALLIGLVFLLAAMAALGAPSLDKRLYYTGLEAREFFSRLSAQDAANYRLNEIIDLGFILLYTFTLVLTFVRLYPRSKLLYWIAFAPAVFDLIETGSILHVLNFGETFPVLSWLGAATFLKWASTVVALGLILRGGLRRVSLG
ncbi:MAG: hypothetical protein AB7K68_00715 [Bacteriovoracia bacterium]